MGRLDQQRFTAAHIQRRQLQPPIRPREYPLPDHNRQQRQPHVADVQRMVERLIEDMGEGGGYIFSNCHNIQPDVPVGNVLAMFQHAREYVPSWAR